MLFYLIDDLEQGSPQWLRWRKGVIGASDAPAVMGENPWKSETYLMQEKLGQVKAFAGNAATREGQRLEPSARAALASDLGLVLKPAVIQDGEVAYLAASLDGITNDGGLICEIKCGEKAYEKARSSRKVPSYYSAQLQHMLMISGHSELIFAAYRPGLPLIKIKVARDNNYISRLRRTEKAFMERLVRRGHQPQQSFVGVARRQ